MTVKHYNYCTTLEKQEHREWGVVKRLIAGTAMCWWDVPKYGMALVLASARDEFIDFWAEVGDDKGVTIVLDGDRVFFHADLNLQVIDKVRMTHYDDLRWKNDEIREVEKMAWNEVCNRVRHMQTRYLHFIRKWDADSKLHPEGPPTVIEFTREGYAQDDTDIPL